MEAVRDDEDYFIIGGASLYTECMGWADSLYLTEIDAELPADTFFPELDRTRWQKPNGKPIKRRTQCLSVLFCTLFA